VYTIYTLPNCGYCTQTKSLLSLMGEKYQELVIGRDLTREEFFEQFPNTRTAPYIIHQDHHIGGYNQLVKYIGSTNS
jgi:glutaredoxin